MTKRKTSGRLFFRKEEYHKGPTPKSERSREQRREDQSRNSSFKFKLVLVGLVVVFGFLIYTFGFIREVDVSGLDQTTSHEVEQLAGDYMSRNWYSRFKPLSSISGLSDSIELADSRFSGTETQMSWLSDTLRISSKLRTPVATWQITGDSTLYLLDEGGVIYLDSQVNASNLLAIRDTTGLNATPSSQAISANALEFILLMDQELSSSAFVGSQDRTYLLVTSSREIQLKAHKLNYVVRFNSSRGVLDQAAELEATLEHIDSENRLPNEYIDLRVDDTAYYL